MALNFLNDAYFAGTVGIGTESPLKKLSINGGDVAVNNGNSFIVGAAITGNTQIGELGADSGQLQLLTESTRDIKFGSTTYGNIMFLEGSNGNVGIGTTSPYNPLTVVGSDSIGIDDYILHNNDGNTKFGFPSNDNFKIRTAGSDRFYINSSGNVGIGTTSPDQKLQIEFANSDTSFSGGSGGDWGSEGIRIENTINTVNTMAMLHFRNNDADVHIASIRQGANDSDLGFFFEGSQKVRFKKDGNVGIGTITPSQKLQVAGNLRVTGAYYDSNNSPGTANQVLVSTVTGTDWIDGSAIPGVPAGSGTLNTIPLWTPDGDTLGNSVMTQSGANIGIGTTSYTNSSGYSTLNINGTSGGQIAFQTAGASKHFIWGTATDFNIYNGQAGPLILYTSATERIRITSAGNVGIGVTGPGDKLSIAGSLSTLHTGYTTKALRVTMNSNDTLLSLYARADQSNQQVLLRTNGNSYLNGGNVGIGTTSPSEKLEVSGSNTLSIKLSRNNTDAVYVTTLTNNYSASLGTELKSGTYNILTHGNGTGTALNFTNGVMTFDYRNSEYMRITSAGNVGIGTTSPGYKLSVNGTIQSDLIRGYTYPDHSFLDFEYDQTAATNSTALTSIARVSYISDSNGNDPATSIGHSFMTGTTDIDTATPLLTILNNGNVGIGTTSPLGNLQIGVGGGGTAALFSGFSGVSHGSLKMFAYGNTTPTIQLSANDSGTGGGTTYFNSGNVGIGTDNPLGKLHVYTASSGATANTNADDFIIESNTNAGISILGDGNETQYIMFGDVANSAIGRITYNHTDNNMSLYTNGSERMRIDSSGNVGIGTTSPQQNLDVVGRVRASYDTSNYYEIGASSAGGFVVGKSGGVETVNIRTYGDSHFNGGNFGIGTSSPTAKLHVVGTGLFTGLVSGITPVAAANFVTKAYVDGSGGGTGPFLPLAGGTMTGTNGVIFPDNFRLKIGTSEDLLIFHDGTDSQIFNQIGDLKIRNDQNDGDIVFMSDDGSGGTTEYFRVDGGITKTVFVRDTKHLDSKKALFGDQDDLQIYHDGSNSYINDTGTGHLVLNTNGASMKFLFGSEFMAQFEANGSVDLYHNNVKKFETTSDGVTVTGQITTTGTSPSILFNETDVTANWRNRVSSGSYRVQYASDGTTFTDYFVLGASANEIEKDTTFGSNVSLTTGNKLIFDGGTDATYISEDVADRLRFFVGGAEFMRFTESTADTVTIYKNTTFSTKAYGVAPITSDPDSTIATKGYVQSVITGATIYRGTWQAGISATSTGTTSSSTTLTVSAAILDAAGNTPTLVGAVVTGAGITGTVKVSSVTSSTVYVLDTAIDATATAYIFSPIYGAPDLSGVTQTSGYYYICSEAGSATPNGAGTEPNTWGVGDWVIWNDDVGSGEWQKVDNSSVLSGAGTGQTVALWEGPASVTDSETLGNAPITVSGSDTTFVGTVTVGTGIINDSIGGDIAITQGAIGLRINDSASAISPTTASANNDNAVDLGVSNIRFKNLYLGGSITSGGGATFAGSINGGDINLSSTNNAIIDPLSVGNILRFTDNDPTQNNNQITGTIEWETKDSNNPGIQSFITTNSTNQGKGRLVFGTGLGGSAVEKMRIDSDGNVGIGVTEPDNKLMVQGASTNGAASAGNVALFEGPSGTNGLKVFVDDTENAAGFQTISADDLLINPHGGNVGIGVTGPTTHLEVVASQSNSSIRAGGLEMQSYAVNNGWYAENLYYDGGWKLRSNGYATQMYMQDSKITFNRFVSGNAGDFVTPYQTMILDSNGKVGISTTNPSAQLQVTSAGGNGSAGYTGYGILTTAGGSSQATIGVMHDGDGYASLNLGSNVSGSNVFWHISKRTAVSTDFGGNNGLDYWYYNGSSFTNVFGFSTTGNFKAAGSIQMADDTATASAAKVGTMRYRTGTEYVDVDGTNLISNPDFTTDTVWTKETGWTITGGELVATAAAGNTACYQSPGLTNGSIYRCTFTISEYTSGKVSFRAGTAAANTFFDAVGTYSVIMTAGGTLQGRFGLESGVTTTLKISQCSIVEVTAEDASYADMCMQTGSSTYEWVNIVRNTY